jgi:hypothetical protein
MDTQLPIWHAKLADRLTEQRKPRHATVNCKQHYDLIAGSVFLVALSENKIRHPKKRMNKKLDLACQIEQSHPFLTVQKKSSGKVRGVFLRHR